MVGSFFRVGHATNWLHSSLLSSEGLSLILAFLAFVSVVNFDLGIVSISQWLQQVLYLRSRDCRTATLLIPIVNTLLRFIWICVRQTHLYPYPKVKYRVCSQIVPSKCWAGRTFGRELEKVATGKILHRQWFFFPSKKKMITNVDVVRCLMFCPNYLNIHNLL